MSNERDYKAFTDALEQFATQYGYKVTNIGLSRPPMEFVGGSATDSLTRLNVLPVSLEVSFRDMMDSEEVTENSEKTVLPDWCKVGEWCYCLDDDGNPKYFKITRIEDRFIYGEDWDIDYHLVRQARIRPWTFEEAPIVLKVKDPYDFALAYLSPFGGKYVIAYHHPDEYEKLKLGEVTFTFSAFADIFTQIDGKPCGVLEHLENGEWVE